MQNLSRRSSHHSLFESSYLCLTLGRVDLFILKNNILKLLWPSHENLAIEDNYNSTDMWLASPKNEKMSICIEYRMHPLLEVLVKNGHLIKNTSPTLLIMGADQWTRIWFQILIRGQILDLKLPPIWTVDVNWLFSDLQSINMAPPLHKLLVCQLHEKFCSLYLNVQQGDPPIPTSLYYFNSFSLSPTRLIVADIPQMIQNGFKIIWLSWLSRQTL